MISVLGSHHHFSRFLADFLEESVRPAVQQAGDIAGVGVAPVLRQATLDDLSQACQGIRGQRGFGHRGLLVNGLRVFQDRVPGLPLAIVIDTEKAAVTTGVAGNARRVTQLANLQQNNVLIAIAADFMHGLHPGQVLAELERRAGTSGIEEKALRKALVREGAGL